MRDAKAHDQPNAFSIWPHSRAAYGKTETIPVPPEINKGGDKGNILADHGGKGRSEGVHAQTGDKDEIQNDVQDRCDRR